MFKRLFISVLVISVISSCSTRKNSFTNRTYHKATAWFNTLFNGQEAMDAKLNELQQSHTDDYFETLSVSPYSKIEVNDNAEIVNYKGGGQGVNVFGQIASGNVLDSENSSHSGFEKAEEKALKAINNHSMVVRNEERNKLMSLAYLILGKARYYQGKPFQALEALNQVEQMPFEKHKVMAKYYSALAQVQLGNNYAAAEILDPLYFNKDLKKSEKALIAQQYAELFYKEENYESAINALEEAIKNTKSKKQRARLNYIEGQILTEIKDFQLANEKFLNAYKLNPGFEMEARAQVSRGLNFQPKKDNYSDFVADLQGAIKKGTYQKYRNEFYYALGSIEEKRDSINLAKKNYLQALKEEMSSPRYRAETFAALGNLYFNNADYVYADAYYDSAVSSMPESKRKQELSEFSKNLSNVMKMHYLVMKDDSILNIASLAPADQKDFFNNYIEILKKEDAKRTKEEEAVASNFQTQSKIKSFDNSFDNEDKSKFYFYNGSTKSNGENEFRRIWGNIALQDNWRNSNTGAIATIEEKKAELTGQTDLKNPRRYDVSFYIEQIPGKEKLTALKMERDTTQLSLGVAYNDLLSNPKLATETLENLISTPPKKDSVLLEASFQLYRINNGKNEVIANKYKNFVLNKYPNSLYAEFIKNPKIDLADNNSPEILALYDKAYALYEDKEYKDLESFTENVLNENKNQPIIPKFALLNALAKHNLGKEDAFYSELNNIITTYKDTPEAEKAKYLLSLKGNTKTEKIKIEEVQRPKIEIDKKEKDTTPENTEEDNQEIGRGINIFG